jgi:hypothetical protein
VGPCEATALSSFPSFFVCAATPRNPSGVTPSSAATWFLFSCDVDGTPPAGPREVFTAPFQPTATIAAAQRLQKFGRFYRVYVAPDNVVKPASRVDPNGRSTHVPLSQ